MDDGWAGAGAGVGAAGGAGWGAAGGVGGGGASGTPLFVVAGVKTVGPVPCALGGGAPTGFGSAGGAFGSRTVAFVIVAAIVNPSQG